MGKEPSATGRQVVRNRFFFTGGEKLGSKCCAINFYWWWQKGLLQLGGKWCATAGLMSLVVVKVLLQFTERKDVCNSRDSVTGVGGKVVLQNGGKGSATTELVSLLVRKGLSASGRQIFCIHRAGVKSGGKGSSSTEGKAVCNFRVTNDRIFT